jgi:DNA replication protein DnaC
MRLESLKDATNIVLVGPNGVGTSTIAQNIAHQTPIEGHIVLFTSAGQLLGDLCARDSDSALRRGLLHCAGPALLVIDEVGYLSYSNRHADLVFELISRRHQNKSTLVTPNRRFAEWREVFPNAPAWSRWWTSCCTMLRSSRSRAIPAGSKSARSYRAVRASAAAAKT